MTRRTELLRALMFELYARHNSKLLAHGWHHVEFVTRKSLEFAVELGVSEETVEAAALTHDLNYVVDPKSHVEAGQSLRQEYLSKCRFSDTEILQIESAVQEASTKNRHEGISEEAKALADADSLFKVLPISPIVFSGRFIEETGVSIEVWADTITRQQGPLLDQGEYFYTKTAKKRYGDWARLNLELVETIRGSLSDPDVQELLRSMKRLGLL